MKKKPTKATNQKAAAAILRKEMGLTDTQALDLVKRAKDGGCAAFDQRGCIDMQILKKWIGDNREALSVPAPMSLKDQKLNEEIRKLKIANDNKEGRLIDRSKGLEVLGRMAERMRKALEQKLCNEYPSQVVSLEVPQARVFGKRLFDAVMVDFQGACEEWRGL
jgi:hypothetical protein